MNRSRIQPAGPSPCRSARLRDLEGARNLLLDGLVGRPRLLEHLTDALKSLVDLRAPLLPRVPESLELRRRISCPVVEHALDLRGGRVHLVGQDSRSLRERSGLALELRRRHPDHA